MGFEKSKEMKLLTMVCGAQITLLQFQIAGEILMALLRSVRHRPRWRTKVKNEDGSGE
jgi:hypothetical protein